MSICAYIQYDDQLYLSVEEHRCLSWKTSAHNSLDYGYCMYVECVQFTEGRTHFAVDMHKTQVSSATLNPNC